MGITRKHHAIRISGRGSLAGRFTRNIDYNSEDYGDGSGLRRISMRKYIEDNEPSNWDRQPPPGTAWKLGEKFNFTCTAYGFGNSFASGSSVIYFSTQAECVPYAHENGWIVTIEEWEAMGSPTYSWGGPITTGVYAGYVMRVTAIQGTWIAPVEWFIGRGQYQMIIRTDGTIEIVGANYWSHLDQRLEVGKYTIGGW